MVANFNDLDKELSVSSAIANYLWMHKINTAFVVTGGAALHLIHSFSRLKNNKVIAMHHEQSAAMAADSFARSSRSVGLAIATSGPGATNLITGIAGSFYDSTKTLFLTGQVSRNRMIGTTGVRQIGFQETPIVGMVEKITKYAAQVQHKDEIRYVLEKALWELGNGRPGPVLVDIPDDIQREFVVWANLKSFVLPPKAKERKSSLKINQIIKLLRSSKRPVLIGGWGIHVAKAEDEFVKLVNQIKVPTLLTWAAADILPAKSKYRFGTFGTHGTRLSNLIVQRSDLLISLGSRLDTKATGSPVSTFAPFAKKVMIDADINELNKFDQRGLEIDIKVESDAKYFIQNFLKRCSSDHSYKEWQKYINSFKSELEDFDEIHRFVEGINPYEFMKTLIKSSPQSLDIFLDTGSLLPWFFQVYEPKKMHRVFHDFNNTAMGWSIPALFAGLVPGKQKTSICIVGDGSLMMSIQELCLFKNMKIPAKIVLIDNSGYSMIKQTEDQWFKSDYKVSSTTSGLVFPKYDKVAEASYFDYIKLNKPSNISVALQKFWESKKNIFLHVCISPEARVIPQVKFGSTIENMEPFLPKGFFLREDDF